jgi:putative SOS response-associated peptidase YedK
MCGRFALTPVRTFKEHYDLSESFADMLIFSHNIAPSTQITTITRTDHSEARLMKWGWWKGKVINARIETVEKKPWFHSAFKNNRCIIPVSSFYEWKEEAGKKIPYRFILNEREVFSLAGIFRKDPDNQSLECLILTMKANASVLPYHHRMPVILPDSWESYWLSNHLDIPLSQLMVANESLSLNQEKLSPSINSTHYNETPEVFHEA